jgi:hypothetical protein
MGFQTNNALCAHNRIMDCASGQIEAITSLECKLLMELG